MDVAAGIYGNFRFLTYFFVNSITEMVWRVWMRPLATVTNPQQFIEEKAVFLQMLLEILWTFFLIAELFPLRWIIKKKRGFPESRHSFFRS